MSLIRAVLRLATVAALRERTWAGPRVFDSDNTPLVDALGIGETAKPYIVVFTDEDGRPDLVGSDVYSARRQLELVLEIGVASAVMAESGDAVLQFPRTDAAMELVLDMLQAQAIAAVLGDAQSEWGEIVRDLLFGSVARITSQRGGSSEPRARWAARQVTIMTDTIADMPAGAPWPPGHPVLRFIAKAKAETVPGIADAATLIEGWIAAGDAYPSWQQAQQWLGLTRRGLRGIGLAPLTDIGVGASPYAVETGDAVTAPDGEAPQLDTTDVDDEDAAVTIAVEPLTGPSDPAPPPPWLQWPYYG